MNVTIGLNFESFANVSGIFTEVYAGKLTNIVERFQELGANDILSLVIQRDERGRTPLDLAWYGFPIFLNIILATWDSKT